MNESNDDPEATVRGEEQTAPVDDLDTATVAPAASASPLEDVAPATRRERPTLATGGAGRTTGDASGTLLGEHLLVEMIGRGGMGAVYRARQETLEREVAVKMILAEYAGQQLVEKLFLSEARVTGVLEHPGIVPVHQLGRTEDGRPFLSMKLVRGTEWGKLIREDAGTTLRQHLDILLKVCDAIAFAHSRQILHRDLKPANVMVGEFGEVQVMDWGIAIALGEPTANPRTLHRADVRSPAGTPAYMAPEMAKPDPERLGPPSDVYLLGGILYELLTGSPPHRGVDTRAVLEAARSGVVQPPQERAPARRIPAELARIALRALAPEPAERFPTATALGEAVRDYLSHEESLKLAEEAGASLTALARYGAVPAAERYATYTQALARLGEALHLWPGNEAAARRQASAALDYADEALERGDSGLAAAQLPLIRANAHADAARRDALAAALAAQASALGRTRLALAFIVAVAAMLYAALGGTRHSVVDAEERELASARLGRTLAEAWGFVRAADIAGLAGPEAALNDPALTRLDGYARRVEALRYARAILLWQRERWEELSEEVAVHGLPPAWPPVPVSLKSDRGRPRAGMPGGRPWTERDFALFPPLVQVALSDPKVQPYLSTGLKNGRTGELLASLARAASFGEPPPVLEAAIQAARDLTGEPRASPDERRWFALGAAAVHGQAYRAAQARGDSAALSALQSSLLPFRLSLPKRAQGRAADGTSREWEEAPAQIGFNPADLEWLKLSADAAGFGFHYAATRQAAHVAVAVPADDGTALVLSAHAVARLDWAPRQVTARTILPAAPVLGWPDPIDRAKLAVLVEDDGEPRSFDRVIDSPDRLRAFLDRGGLLPLDTGSPAAPAGAVRTVALAFGEASWPTTDVTGTRAFLMQNLAPPPEFDRVRDPDYARKLGTLYTHLGQDRTDVHAALFVLSRGRAVLSTPAVDHLLRRLLPAAAQASPDDEAQAAVVLEHAGHSQEARLLLAEAARRQSAAGNPEIATGSTTARLLRQVALARLDTSPAWALAVLEASLHFARHDAADGAIAARLASLPEDVVARAELAPDVTAAALRAELLEPVAEAPAARARGWRRDSAGLAALCALVALALMVRVSIRARSTRLADLHHLGWRTRSERLTAFLTHPVARLRHIWAAYATRPERVVVALAAAGFVLGLTFAATAHRLREPLAVFFDNQANVSMAAGDLHRALQERHDLGSRWPALLRALAEAQRARGAPALATLDELVQVAPDDAAARNDRAVALEEAGLPGVDAAYELAARAAVLRADARVGAVIAWNQARRSGDVKALDTAESRLDPAGRRRARALRSSPPIRALREPCTSAELAAAALDPLTVRRELDKTLVHMVFEPEAQVLALRAALATRTGVALASCLAALAALLTLTIVLGGLVAFIWLPLPVRPRLAPELRRAPGASS